MMLMYQDDKNECELDVIVETTHVKRKKTVISLLIAVFYQYPNWLQMEN